MIKRNSINSDNNSKHISYQTGQSNIQTHVPINGQFSNLNNNSLMGFNPTPRHNNEGPGNRINQFQQFGQNQHSNDQLLK